jgi:hypothetical protein
MAEISVGGRFRPGGDQIKKDKKREKRKKRKKQLTSFG